jgi:hypothetical protein
MVADMEVKEYMFAHLTKKDEVIACYGIQANSYKKALESVKRTQEKHDITKRSRVYTQTNFFKTHYWKQF